MTITLTRTGDGRTFATCTDCPKTYGPGPKAEADDWADNHTCPKEIR